MADSRDEGSPTTGTPICPCWKLSQSKAQDSEEVYSRLLMFNDEGLCIDGARSDAIRITSESHASQYSFGDKERVVTAYIELS